MTQTTEDKFLEVYKARRTLYDAGKGMEEHEGGIQFFFDLVKHFNKRDLFSMIDEMKQLVSEQEMSPPFDFNIVLKVEQSLIQNTRISGSDRWKLIMMMSDWMDKINGKLNRPKTKGTNILKQKKQLDPKLFEHVQ